MAAALIRSAPQTSPVRTDLLKLDLEIKWVIASLWVRCGLIEVALEQIADIFDEDANDCKFFLDRFQIRFFTGADVHNPRHEDLNRTTQRKSTRTL